MKFDIQSKIQADKRAAAAADVAKRIRSLGYQAYFAGGCCRDWLLGRDPKDIDIATDAIPLKTKDAWPASRFVGEAFGVTLVKHRGYTFEVATFRSDGEYSDGRRPDNVELHTSPEEDAKRRDFTINALFMDPETGEVIDYVGGVSDLEAGMIRAVGDPEKRFAEDHLRMLRAVRFGAQLGFEIERQTLVAICKNRKALLEIARERTWAEMTKLLLGAYPSFGFRLLFESGLFSTAFPEIHWMDYDCPKVSEMLRLLERYRKSKPDPLTGLPSSDLWWSEALCWAILFHPLQFDCVVRNELAAWPIPADLAKKVASLVVDLAEHGPPNFPNYSLSDQKRWLRRPHLEEHMLLWALHFGVGWVPQSPNAVADVLKDITDEKIYRTNCEPHKSMNPPVLLDGHELQKLGYAPGPLFSKMIAALEEEQLMERIQNKEEAIKFVLAEFPITGE